MNVHTPQKNTHTIAKSMYGLLVVTALIVTLEGTSLDAWHIVLSILSTMFVIGIAETYAELIAYRSQDLHLLSRRGAREKIREGMTVTGASFIPTLFFVGAGVQLYTLEQAFLFAKLFTIFILFSSGVAFGKRRGKTNVQSLLIGMVEAGLGVGIILFKAWVEHATK